jgi:hypothetical protein
VIFIEVLYNVNDSLSFQTYSVVFVMYVDSFAVPLQLNVIFPSRSYVPFVGEFSAIDVTFA